MKYIKHRKEVVDGVRMDFWDIYLTRADSAEFGIDILDADDNPIEITAEDTIRCQVRTEPTTGELLFSSIIADNSDPKWQIAPSDTAELDPGEYYWDGQVEFSTGEVYTFVNVSKFIVMDEVAQPEV